MPRLTALTARYLAPVLTAILLTGAGIGRADEPISAMIKVRLSTGLVEGRPLSWSESSIMLLARDGQLVNFRPERAKDFRQSAPRFYSYSPSEMRSRLLSEFGNGFEVTATRHYLIVHPPGKKELWTGRFEDIYRDFYLYFRVRGFKLRDAQFPLVAVVFPDRKAYLRYTAKLGQRISPNYLGHYSPTTNRIYTFDSTAGRPGADWAQNEATIIHEAVHQAAFNTGVHRRLAGTPRWVSEGLAMMFEAPGVYNASRYRSRQDRINRERLHDFKKHLARRPDDSLQKLIASDDLFATDPLGAYAEAWALTFFLSETRGRAYSKYLAITAERPEFRNYTAEQRRADFTRIFGSNWKLLDAELLRYTERLR